jgi:hypothetical protein
VILKCQRVTVEREVEEREAGNLADIFWLNRVQSVTI